MIMKVFRVHSPQVLRFECILPFSSCYLYLWYAEPSCHRIPHSMPVSMLRNPVMTSQELRETLQGFAASSSLELSRSMI